VPQEPELLLALAAVIREHRQALDLTQESMGDLHRNYIGGVERGQINPTVTQLARIASALGTSAGTLLSEAETRQAERG
jgi:transcriptional regulator with XRE-family HTH domain